MLMVHRFFLGMIGEEKLKNPSLISMQCGEGAHGEQKTTKAFFISFLFFFIYRRFISRFFPPFFSLFSTSSDIINYSETPFTRTLRGLAYSRLRDSLVR